MKILLTFVFAVAIMGLCVSNGTVQANEHPTSDHSQADAAKEEHTESGHHQSEHPE